MMLSKRGKTLFSSLLVSSFIVVGGNTSWVYGSEEENINPVTSTPIKLKSTSLPQRPPLSSAENSLSFYGVKDNEAHNMMKSISSINRAEDTQILKLNGGLLAEEFQPLKNTAYKAIYLHMAYEGIFVDGYFCRQAYLKVSSDTINPKVELLSLRTCGLKDKHIKRIPELTKLKSLFLDSNGITDEGIKDIIKLKNVEVLSLASNKITSFGVQQLLLNMTNLTDLDISGNKAVNDDVVSAILSANQLKKLKILFTGITEEMHQRIKNEQRNLGRVEYFPM